MPAPSVIAVMSRPRIGFINNDAAVVSLPFIGISVMRGSGAFWEKSLSLLLYKVLEAGAEWALVIDYDTVFTHADVTELLRLAEAHHADAIFPVQVKREDDTILCDPLPGQTFLGEVTPCRAGHFGLTLIRCAKLATLPHPWLMGRPDEDTCRWDGKIHDADMLFWQITQAEGWHVYQANRVRVGHIQQVITWPTGNRGVTHQYQTEYERIGKPQETAGSGEAAA